MNRKHSKEIVNYDLLGIFIAINLKFDVTVILNAQMFAQNIFQKIPILKENKNKKSASNSRFL